MEENRDLASAYMLCRGQVVTADQGQIIDINLQTVKVILDEMMVSNKLEIMGKIRKVFMHFLIEQNEKRQAEMGRP